MDRTVANCLDLVLLTVAAIAFEFQLGRRFVHSPLLCGVLLKQRYVKNIVDPLPRRQFQLVGLLSYWV